MGNYATREEYLVAELVPIGVLSGTATGVVPLALLLVIIAIAYCKRYCVPATNFAEQFGNYCGTVYGFIISLVFGVIDERRRPDDGNTVILLVGRIPRTTCREVLVYVYLVLMAWIVSGWFYIVFVENLLYKKITTCNDVSGRDDDFRCFAIDNNFERVNCEEHSNDAVRVICYMRDISAFGSLGVAFGVAQFWSWIVDRTLALAVRGMIEFIAICATIGLVGLLGLIVWPALSNTDRRDANYFYADEGVHWYIYAYLCFTFVVGLGGLIFCIGPALVGRPGFADLALPTPHKQNDASAELITESSRETNL